MKKFLFVLLFLIILGGTGFFLGWAQLTVPPGSYGVMRSKTHGLETEVIRDGEFRWIWYKMIPTNAVVSVYTLGPVRHSFRNSGTLPSGQEFAAVVGLDADFSWEISGEITFSIRPESLPELTARENISTNAELRKIEQNIAERIENLVLQRLRVYMNGGDEEKLNSLIFAGFLPELNREIEALFPEIKNLNCTFRVIRLPDFALYLSLREVYQEYLAWQGEFFRQDIISEAEIRIESRTRLNELAQYGELLTRYPILLHFLALEKGLLLGGMPER